MKIVSSLLWSGLLRFVAPAAFVAIGGCSSPVEVDSAPVAPPQSLASNPQPGYAHKPTFQKTALVAAPATTGDNSNLLLGNPSNAATQTDNLFVSRPQFDLSYNKSQGGPNWVSWHVEASDLGTTRRGQFRPDPLLPSDSQIRPTDYRGSGYDRGHVCPSGDRTSSRENNDATFVMSNMLPQTASLNQKVWAKLENYCRDQVRAGNELYIVAGGHGTKERIGEGKINVPATCWKVIVVLPQGDDDLKRITAQTRVIAVSMPNEDTPEVGKARWATYITTPSAIEATTGYKFFSNVPGATRQALQEKKDSGRAARGGGVGQGDDDEADATATDATATDAAQSFVRPRQAEGARTTDIAFASPRTNAGRSTSRSGQGGGLDAPPAPEAAAGEAQGVQVWVNTNSGIYHYPGARWYGKTKHGEYMSESAANAAGHRAAENGQ